MTSKKLKSLVEWEFSRTINITGKAGCKLFFRMFSQAKMVHLLALSGEKWVQKRLSVLIRSPDINCIHNIFNIVKKLLQQVTIKCNFEQFPTPGSALR